MVMSPAPFHLSNNLQTAFPVLLQGELAENKNSQKKGCFHPANMGVFTIFFSQ